MVLVFGLQTLEHLTITVTEPLFYVSADIKANREAYTDRLLAVSERGEWDAWLQFFISGLRDQADEVLSRAKLLLEQYEQYQERYATAPRSVRRLVDVLFRQPYLTVPTAADRIDMSYPAANTAVQRLIEDGVLIQVGEKERNREFVATEIMSIVEADPASLPAPADALR